MSVSVPSGAVSYTALLSFGENKTSDEDCYLAFDRHRAIADSDVGIINIHNKNHNKIKWI